MKLNIQKILFFLVLSIIGFLVLPPLILTLSSSFHISKGFEPGKLSLAHYKSIFTSLDTTIMFANSIWFSTASSLIALILGTLLAWIVERTNTPFKNLAYLGAFTSFAVPGIIKVIGWILLLGPKAGLFNELFKYLFHLEGSPFNIFSMTGMIFIMAMLWTPVVFIFMTVPFRSMDPSLEESASMSGAGLPKTFYYITFKLALPSVLSVLLLTFVRTLEAFEVPALIGIPGGIMVMTSEIYLKIESGILPNYGLASAYSILLVICVLIGLYYYSKVTSEAQKFYTITGKGFRPKLIELGKWRYLTSALVFIIPAFLLLPFFVLAWASFLPYYSTPSRELLSSVTLSNYVSIAQNPSVISSFKNSMFISSAAATAVMLLTSITAWLVIRTKIKFRILLDHLSSLPLSFPGVVLGVALLVTYLTLPIPIYGTIWLLIIAYLTRYIPYGIRFTYPGLLQINQELEESAQMSGASWNIVFRKILIPLMMPSLFAGWIWVFLHSIRELSVAILLSRPGSEVISVTIFDMWENGQIPEIGAFSTFLTFVLVIISAGFHRLSSRYGLKSQL